MTTSDANQEPRGLHVESMNPYQAIAKPELEALKAGYLKDLAKPGLSPVLRGSIQTELSLINSAIKAINTADAARAKEAADRKKAAGLAEFQANTARALGIAPAQAPRGEIDAATPSTKLQHPRSDLPAATERPTTAAAGSVAQGSRGSLPAATGTTTRVPNGKPPWPKGVHSRGEFILMRAEQLAAQIRKLVCDPLPHTVAFAPGLDAFIQAQRELVQSERTERRAIEQGLRSGLPAATTESPRSGPSEWTETWKDQTAGSEPAASAWPRGWPRKITDTEVDTPCPVCGPKRVVCFIKRDGLRCVPPDQMGPSRWHPTDGSAHYCDADS